MVHVPYKGSAPSVTALMTKEVDLSFGALSAFDAVIKDGRVRALAVTTAERSTQLPGVPTVIESGVPGFDVDIWYGLVVPAKTPASIIKKMSSDLARVLEDPEIRDKLRQRGVEPAYLDPEQTGELMRRDVARWREVGNSLNLALD